MMTNTDTKAVGYVRVSTDEQARNGQSLQAQKASIREWADKAHTQLLRIFEDAGISGAKLRQRPALLDALKVSCEQKAVLIVYSLSRLSRSTKDTLQIAEKLDKAGADLVSLSEKIDTTSASGKMLFRLMAVLNEFERDQISERTSVALQHMKAKGLVYSPIPFGYKRDGDRLIPVVEELQALEMMKHFRTQGKSYAWIAKHLIEESVPTKNGGKWYPATVRRMLKNALHVSKASVL
ncbi:MAG: recombinase family protein [Candidatus Sabulitectum sp.]|nr:recombinase family protein [Candidatus Sabulitectum sp.]